MRGDPPTALSLTQVALEVLNLIQVKSSKFLAESGTAFICLKHHAKKQGVFFDFSNLSPCFSPLEDGSSSLGYNNLEIKEKGGELEEENKLENSQQPRQLQHPAQIRISPCQLSKH